MSRFFIHDFISKWPGTFGLCENNDYRVLDSSFIARILSAARRADSLGVIPDGLWADISATHDQIRLVAASNDVGLFQSLLENCFKTSLTTGFEQDNIVYNAILSSGGYNAHLHLNYVDKLIALAEAVRALPVQNPERSDHEPFRGVGVDELLDRIEMALSGFRITAPKPQTNLYGLRSRRGVFTDRHFAAIYVAKRIREIVGTGAKVCEIGGGMGYVGYFSRALGIQDYTIVDLPTVGALQAWMLAANYGADEVVLSGEDTKTKGFKILNPIDFANSTEQYDIIVNVDSFPEMATRTMHSYVRAGRSRFILSCNQESLDPRTSEADRLIRVGEELDRIGGYRQMLRAPFWMRRGYVEELFERVAT